MVRMSHCRFELKSRGNGAVGILLVAGMCATFEVAVGEEKTGRSALLSQTEETGEQGPVAILEQNLPGLLRWHTPENLNVTSVDWLDEYLVPKLGLGLDETLHMVISHDHRDGAPDELTHLIRQPDDSWASREINTSRQPINYVEGFAKGAPGLMLLWSGGTDALWGSLYLQPWVNGEWGNPAKINDDDAKLSGGFADVWAIGDGPGKLDIFWTDSRDIHQPEQLLLGEGDYTKTAYRHGEGKHWEAVTILQESGRYDAENCSAVYDADGSLYAFWVQDGKPFLGRRYSDLFFAQRTTEDGWKEPVRLTQNHQISGRRAQVLRASAAKDEDGNIFIAGIWGVAGDVEGKGGTRILEVRGFDGKRLVEGWRVSGVPLSIQWVTTSQNTLAGALVHAPSHLSRGGNYFALYYGSFDCIKRGGSLLGPESCWDKLSDSTANWRLNGVMDANGDVHVVYVEPLYGSGERVVYRRGRMRAAKSSKIDPERAPAISQPEKE